MEQNLKLNIPVEVHQFFKKCWVRRGGGTATWLPLGGQHNVGDRLASKCHRFIS